MRYRITAPTRGFQGDVAGIAFTRGVAEVDVDETDRALRYFRRRGYQVQALERHAEEDERDETGPAEDTPPGDPAARAANIAVGEAEPPKRPNKAAPKDAFVAYAVAVLGIDTDQANAMTRPELMAAADAHEQQQHGKDVTK